MFPAIRLGRLLITTPAGHFTPSGANASLFVGRAREQQIVHDHLAAIQRGESSLVLISGEAGIGKTALAETLCREAADQGMAVLVGRCYDLAETPPYGPWRELFSRYAPIAGTPADILSFPSLTDAGRGPPESVVSQAALFEHVRDCLTVVAAARPLVLLLEDLQWADNASLDLLRFLARRGAALPVLLIATYRLGEVTPRDALHHLLPTLVREARATRLDLRPLGDDDVRALIAARYRLDSAEALPLVTYVQARAQGNPFFIREVLRTLEEEGALARDGERWAVGSFATVRIPPLLRQIVEQRLERVGTDARGLLASAAIIGQEVPLDLWVAVAAAPEETVLAAAEHLTEHTLLEESSDGMRIRFTHALIRAVLYEGILPTRRRRMHQQVADVLIARRDPDPDAVAYHFRQAADDRAVLWLLRAGERAQRAYAWLTAAERFEAALDLMDGEMQEGGWLHFRLAMLRRYLDPTWSLVHLDDAAAWAVRHDDPVLAALTRFYRGHLRAFAEDFCGGLPEMEAGVAAIESLSDTERAALAERQEAIGYTLGMGRSTLVLWLSIVGRYAAAREAGAQAIAMASADAVYADLDNGLMQAYAALGLPEEADAAFVRARDRFRTADHWTQVSLVTSNYLDLVAVPYAADDVAARQRLAAESEQALAWSAGRVLDPLPPRLARLPLLFLEGAWAEIPTLAAAVETYAGTYRLTALRARAQLAREQADAALAWRLIRTVLPQGAATEAGGARFHDAVAMQRLAVTLAIDTGDLPTARRWLDAYDRWLAWSGAVLGQSEAAVLWARYQHAVGDAVRARQQATDALALALSPRQPLAALAAHRLLGELDTEAHRFTDAATHLDQAIALADACAAPYERVLTALAQAELFVRTGERGGAAALLDEVRAICLPLGARLALVRASMLATMLGDMPTASRPAAAWTNPDGLTAREVEVLRLIAAGMSNREMAAAISVSIRTVERHLENLYRKTNANNRADATAYAFRHHLL